MPYQPPPSRYASTRLSDTMPGMQPPRPAANKPAMPPTPTPDPKRATRNPFMDRVSPKKFDAKPDAVFEQLFGEKMDVDPVTDVVKNFQPKARAAAALPVNTPPPPLVRPQETLQHATVGRTQPIFQEPNMTDVFSRLFPAQRRIF